MEKRKQFLYALIASAVVTALIGAGILRRVDRMFYIPYTGRPGNYYDGVSIARLI